MAILSADQKAEWNKALRACGSPWIAFGLATEGTPSYRLNGMAGLIDWHLHGQVSSLLSQRRLGEGDFCLIPGVHGRPSFLLYHYPTAPDLKSFLSRVRLLKVRELCVAESTFPGDFSAKLKQNLGKEGISCTKLEPTNS